MVPVARAHPDAAGAAEPSRRLTIDSLPAASAPTLAGRLFHPAPSGALLFCASVMRFPQMARPSHRNLGRVEGPPSPGLN